MKALKMLIVFLLSFDLNAQVVDFTKEIDWNGIECSLSDERKLSLLSNINEDLFYYLKDNQLLEKSLADFHFVDLNGDKILDFIYLGYAGGEQPSTIAFTQNTKGYFKRVFEAIGTIYEISNIALVDGCLKFKVVKNDECYDCLGVVNSTTYLACKGTFTEIERLSFTKSTEVPDITFNKQFKVVNPQYYLRSTPVVENEGNTPDALFGNVVAEYSAGAMGYAYASREDETGRVWWFVAIKSDEASKVLFQQKEGYIIGWMSSRFLEEL